MERIRSRNNREGNQRIKKEISQEGISESKE